MTTRPTTSLYEKYAASGAENYERHFVPAIGEPVARRLVDAARPARGERVLDIACGTGIAARLAAEAVGPDGTVAGLDANPGMLEVARTVSPDRIEWHAAPAEDMPLPDAAFDLALCSMGLQFFADKDQALRETLPGARPRRVGPCGARLDRHHRCSWPSTRPSPTTSGRARRCSCTPCSRCTTPTRREP